MGEGMSMQLARDGRRVLWLAHESAPKNFTAVDVTEPRSPKVIVQTDLPHAQMRSNSLEVSGDLMAVAYQVSKFGLKPAGFELFDISRSGKTKSISFFDASGPHSRGCHQLWFVDGKTVHMACADPELKPRNPKDDQVYRIVDVANPSKPVAVGRWHLPGTMEGDDAPPPSAFRRSSTPVPRAQHQRLSRAPGPLLPRVYRRRRHGARHLRPRGRKCFALDQLAAVQRLQPHRAAVLRPGAPRGERRVGEGQRRGPPQAGLAARRARREHLVSISTLPMPPVDAFKNRGGRFGAHNLHENPPVPGAWRSEDVVLGTFFNGGVRAYDVSDPYSPRESGVFRAAPAGALQDGRRAAERRLRRRPRHRVHRRPRRRGLYILEMKL